MPVTARAPIADVAGDASAQAALSELAGELTAARKQGRMVVPVPLEAVDDAHLVRDRMQADPQDMEVLEASLRARGQQTPIEVTELEPGRYGLISGWRRLTALRRLHAETGEDRFARVHCLVRAPETASDAYLAMVEENEIRADLSFYERARIAARAAEQGAFPTPRDAVRALFASASRAKRSKINSFLTLYDGLDDVLRHPSHISERLGLALAKALEAEPDLADRLRARMARAPEGGASAELAAIDAEIKRAAKKTPDTSKTVSNKAVSSVSPKLDVTVSRSGQGHLVLSGDGVTEDFEADLKAWLLARRKRG